MILLEPEWLHRDGALRSGEAVLARDDGAIVAIGPRDQVAPGQRGERLAGALIPGLVSAHSHAFQVMLRGWADHPRDFADWVASKLYPLVLDLDDDLLEAASLLCFSDMARAGITTVGEFHYVHNDADGRARGNELDELVLRAARRVGLRVGFLRTFYDVQSRPGQRRFVEPPERAVESTRALAARFAGDPLVTVMPAPHSLHGATRAAIEAGAALARERGTRWHVHLAEQRGDVERSKEKHGATPLRALDAIGVLDARATIVHGVWLDDGERALLAERGAMLVSCPGTSIALGDGVADLRDLVARGVTVGLGTDMNARPDLLYEARLAEQLQRARRNEMGVLEAARPGARGGALLLDMATRQGAATLGLDAGVLAPGKPLDAVHLDVSGASFAPAIARGPDALLDAIVSIGGPANVRDVFVGGRRIVAAGLVLGIDDDDVAARIRNRRLT